MEYNIRDLSWLSFNDRVLQEAQNKNSELLSRLRFLGIFSNNLDEFYRVRVATLKRMSDMKKNQKMYMESNPKSILNSIQKVVAVQRKIFDDTYDEILEEMKAKGIVILNEQQLNKTQQDFVVEYFNSKVRTSIVPIMLESVPQMPVLRDDSIYLACVLNREDSPMMQRYALIEVPSDRLPRFIMLPKQGSMKPLILLEDIIRYNLPNLFQHFGFDKFSSYIVKFTKDAEIDLDSEDFDDNVADLIRKGLKERRKAKAVRFIYDKEIDAGLLTYLIKRLDIHIKDDVIAGGRIHNFKDFMNFPDEVFRKSRTKKINPFVHPKLQQPRRIMQVLDKEDVMLHFPYHSFDSVIDLLREAAIDPQVETIKITAYRLAENSKIIHALILAAQNGKEVTVILELKARFDEQNNLSWQTVLEDNGVKVYLGIRNMKVHSKLCLITKTNEGKSIRYAFLSTGNFNEDTAKVYADHCLMTSNKAITKDVEKLFDYLENPDSKMKKMDVLVMSPYDTRDFFLAKINEAISKHSKKNPSSIYIKLNSFIDKKMIDAIYDAHRKGVNVFLNIRSILTAKVKKVHGFKTEMHAISIVDKRLEHARMIWTQIDGIDEYYLSSADWMARNLDHRIETSFPIFDPKIQKELKQIYELQRLDNVKARILDDKQSNHFVKSDFRKPLRSQVEIYKYLKAIQY